ncbi:hypothetical protein K502DRAFT_348384 [Neoconidiobolus thromboides FSU 785]|nr:hypothetical protein K502DRAFT_348384 [Neoconidiobolus thromboides FSU 785]
MLNQRFKMEEFYQQKLKVWEEEIDRMGEESNEFIKDNKLTEDKFDKSEEKIAECMEGINKTARNMAKIEKLVDTIQDELVSCNEKFTELKNQFEKVQIEYSQKRDSNYLNYIKSIDFLSSKIKKLIKLQNIIKDKFNPNEDNLQFNNLDSDLDEIFMFYEESMLLSGLIKKGVNKDSRVNTTYGWDYIIKE